MPKHNYNRRTASQRHIRMRTSAQTGLVMNGFGSGGMLLALCVLIAGGLYLFTINTSAVRGAEIYALEQEIEKYELEREELSIRVAELDTIQYAQDTIIEKKMRPIGSVDYIGSIEEQKLALEKAE